jgi:hypothetical protein
MQLHGLATFVESLAHLAAPDPDQDHGRGKCRQQRLNLRAVLERGECLVELPERRIHERTSHIRGSVRRSLTEDFSELRFRICEPVLVHVQAVGAIASQLRSQTTRVNGARMRFEELGVYVSRRAHAKCREHQVAR